MRNQDEMFGTTVNKGTLTRGFRPLSFFHLHPTIQRNYLRALTPLTTRTQQKFPVCCNNRGLWWLSRYSTDQQIQTAYAAAPRPNPATPTVT
jgi:hypothetical protein